MMNKSKLLYAIATLVFGMAFTTTVSSCGSDDDGINGESTKTPTVAATTIHLDIKLSENLIEYTDFIIKYKNDQGKDVTEPVNTTAFQKNITITRFPSTITLTYTKKEGVIIEPDEKITIKHSISYYPVYTMSDGTTGETTFLRGYDDETELTGAQFEMLMQQQLDTYTISIDKNGYITTQ